MLANGHGDAVTGLAVGKRGGRGPFNAGELLCSASADGFVRLWDVRLNSKNCYSTIPTAPDESLLAVDVSDSVIACAGKGRTLYMFDVASEEPIRQFKQHHSDWIHSVALGTDRVFSGGRDKLVKILTSAKISAFAATAAPVPTASAAPVNKPRATTASRPFQRLSEMFTSSAEKSE